MHRHFVGIFRAAIESFSGFKVFIDKSNRRKQTDGRTRAKGESEDFLHILGDKFLFIHAGSLHYINFLFSPVIVSFYFSSTAKLRFVNCCTKERI